MAKAKKKKMKYNILFYTDCKVTPTKGGTERTTISVATGLKNLYGCKCYSAYKRPADTPMEKCFENEFIVDYETNPRQISDIIERYDIHIVINQGDFDLYLKAGKLIRINNVRYIFAYHFIPASDVYFLTIKNILEYSKNSGLLKKVKNLVKFASWPVYKKWFKNRIRKFYKDLYDYSDQVVLLSDGYIEDYKKFGRIGNNDKFKVIPNALSLPINYDISCYPKKKKKVLIVSRMEETQKRIFLALDIWDKVKKRNESDGWSLDIVGDGDDLVRYKNKVNRERISDVNFYGRQVPDKYYEEASIFLMTSRFEGWGLTLTESQQNAVVPVVFNTVSAFSDIITDGENGFLVSEGDVDGYVDRICQLMSDDSLREKMALNGYHSCQRYTQDKVCEKWYKLISEICDDKCDSAGA